MTNYSDNPQIPSVSSNNYLPDQLIAGDLHRVTENATVLSGAGALNRGTLMGKIEVGAATSAVKASGANTGGGTLTLDVTTPVLAGAKPGVYTVRVVQVAANAGLAEVKDPSGAVLGLYNVGAAAFANQIKFAMADVGTDFAVGDGFDITVAAGSGKVIKSLAAALDGSQKPYALLVDTVDATSADKGASLYKTGEFNANAVTFGTGHTQASTFEALRDLGIFLKNPLSAADPS